MPDQYVPPPTPLSPSGAAPVTLEWVTVTPEVALRWLTRNKDNRRMKPSIVDFYARQMTAGLWAQDSPEPVIFDQEGWLLNGQHRLEAVTKADVPVRLAVARGVSRDTRLFLDTGASRTGADALQMEYPEMRGDKARVYASAIRGLEVWKARPEQGPHEFIASRIPNLSLTRLYPHYEERFELLYPMAEGIHQAGVRGGSGLWLIMLYRFAALTYEGAAEFADKVATGADLPEKSPILALRDRLNRMPVGETKLRRQLVARLIVNAWNAWRRGVPSVTRLLLRDDVEFPTPVVDNTEYRRLSQRRQRAAAVAREKGENAD
jgi:hypothetical protein